MKLELDYPVTPFFITQPFGVNGEYYRANRIDVLGHNGLDLRARHGQPLYAAHDGQAYYTDDDGKEGQGVVIISNDKREMEGSITHYKTIYWHLCNPHEEPQYASPVFLYREKTKGKPMPIKAGQIVGYADNTGFSNGDHLHFGLKPVALKESPRTWWNRKQNNGYGGAIDPMPYFKKATLSPWEQLAIAAAKEQAAGRSAAAAQVWALVAFVRAFTK